MSRTLSLLPFVLLSTLSLPVPAPARSSEIAFATCLGGSLDDEIGEIAVDAGGHVWITGTTRSPDFFGAGAPPEPDPDVRFPSDGFLVRLTPAGGLIASDYVGGPLSDSLAAIAIDPAGSPWEVGTTSNEADTSVLLARGTSMETFNRFSLFDRGNDLGFDTAGNLYILAATEHGFDLFVQKRNPAGQEIYVTELRPDFSRGFAVGGDGTAYVQGGGDLIRLDPAGNPFYLPASLAQSTTDIAADAAGNLHVVGTRNEDFYYARLDPFGNVIDSRTIGGSGGDFGRRIVVGPSGDVAILGVTDSPDFPLLRPVDSTCPSSASRPGRCETTPFVVRLTGTSVVLSTYLDLGGSEPASLALGSQGDVYVAGNTSDPGFPTVNAAQSCGMGGSDGFVLRIAGNQAPICQGAFAHPSELWPGHGRLVPVSIQGVTDPEGDPFELVVTAIRQDEPLTRRGLPDADGVGTSSPRVRAARAGQGNGRVYTIRFEVRDSQGGTCTGEVTVCVPHDRGKGQRCVNGGALHDSTAGR